MSYHFFALFLPLICHFLHIIGDIAAAAFFFFFSLTLRFFAAVMRRLILLIAITPPPVAHTILLIYFDDYFSSVFRHAIFYASCRYADAMLRYTIFAIRHTLFRYYCYAGYYIDADAAILMMLICYAIAPLHYALFSIRCRVMRLKRIPRAVP